VSPQAPDRLASLASDVLGAVGADGAEVTVTALDSALTRFARNRIHQNVAERSLSLRLRLQRDGRAGVAEVRGEPSREAIRRLVEAAERARAHSPAAEQPELPAPGGATGAAAHSEATAGASPEWRAESVAEIVATARRAGVEAFGALQTATTATHIANGRGLQRDAVTTLARLTAVCRGDDGSGYADRSAASIDDLDVAGCARDVTDVCVRNQGAQPIEPGDYEVVLSPAAVTEVVAHLADMGFSAQAVHEQRSFMRPGEKLMHESVSIADDATAPAGLPFPFDDEGVIARRVGCIDHGVCGGVLHDSLTAMRDGVASTGHALPMPNAWGPWARHLVMAAGDRSLDELIAGCGRGLLVTRFWYVRNVHLTRTIITGMTREGTFLIEDGRIVRPVRDLRFTQSIVEALADVRGLGSERHLSADEMGRAVLVPAVHLGHFSFTSS
jgi:PmbA protein